MENIKLVSKNDQDVCRRNSSSQATEDTFIPPLGPGGNSPSLPQASFDDLHLVSTKIKRSGVSRNALKIIMSSWRKKTRTQYKTYLKRYEAFFQRHGSDPLTPTETISRFLD